MSASVESPSWRTVEVGRLVLINNGPFAGRIAAIVEIISEKRVLVDGPSSDEKLVVPKGPIALSDVFLTDLSLEIPRALRTSTLKTFWEKGEIDKKWLASKWAQRAQRTERRKALTDFQRFQLLRAKKQQRYEVRKALAKVKAAA
ncbi:ribosomal protein L14-domain-containing protein [Xylaria bambusicola]|uniref:ribosomal protein L14-domain-containing protein n=1 Tax=Xylaria bambusicola TaxID=326684 RepID=UPI0020072F51|nr:ribosomal protein L14-domain-containing protein [Xylaria bambusicola]KAI0522284.1 ribosomal protein L14-domain-containing protein [Xylaria bambusicola]